MDADKRKKQSLADSFRCGFQGIAFALKERNVRIHLSIAVLVVLAGFFFSISVFEWVAVLFAIGGMLSFELMNTAIERTVDLYTTDYHPLAKQAKDIAAGAVLIYAILSVIIGILIFFPKIIAVLSS